MSKNLFLIVRESAARKLMDNYCPSEDEFYQQFCGLGGELAMRAAGCQRDYNQRRNLHECLGMLLAMLEWYAFSEEMNQREIVDAAEDGLERMRQACESCNMPNLIFGSGDNNEY